MGSQTEPDRFRVFGGLVRAAFEVAAQQPDQRLVLADEALVAAQRASEMSAAQALTQMAARFAAGDAALAKLAREQQDLSARWRALDKALITALSIPAERNDPSVAGRLRQQRSDIEAQMGATADRLAAEFPDYAALANPQPLTGIEQQQLLGPNEALVINLITDQNVFIWALTRDKIEWQRIDLGESALSKTVAKLRRGLDPHSGARAAVSLDPESLPQTGFDLAGAHKLYQVLLGPVEDVIAGKSHLIVVPAGPLTSLPFHVLVTAEPDGSLEGAEAYRKAAWLMRRQAISVLPSVASLKALRGVAKTSHASKPYIGFGDPRFGPCAPEEAKPIVVAAAGDTDAGDQAAETRGYASYYRGTQADGAKLCALPSLPESADEVRAIARSLGAPGSDIHLQEAATETAVKSARLDQYRIVHFATHGLVAGDITGLGEPGLALTRPREATEEDDGLLTASEVAQLKLDADWVILSACNTAAGDSPGAEALSGLARAFFYAGARALLVSHWPVNSLAAVKLTTGALGELKVNPELGRAEALRRAMLALVDNGASDEANPSYWAPFVVVGEGGAAAASN